jgi:CIC family chloride channel protein
MEEGSSRRSKDKSSFSRIFKGNISGDYTILLLLAGLIGVIVGLCSSVFKWTLNFLFTFLTVDVVGYFTTNFGFIGYLALPVITASGGLFAGVIIEKISGDSRGSGVPQVIYSVSHECGFIRIRNIIMKPLATILTISSGGSAGREGPIVQIGASISSAISQVLRLKPKTIQLLTCCGAGAGIAATFNAPIAGALFVNEVILKDFSSRTFIPIIISTITASGIAHHIYGDLPAFLIPAYHLQSIFELPLYLILGLLAGFTGLLFIKAPYLVEDLFKKFRRIPGYIITAIGGGIVGLMGIVAPEILGIGYTGITSALIGKLTIFILLFLLVMKIVATSLTIGSGGSGGIFAPSLFMGAMLGGAFGVLVNMFIPGYTAQPGAYALVGMASMVSGVTFAPISSILIIFEMTMDYKIILPLMLAVAVSSLICRLFSKDSIYTEYLKRIGVDTVQCHDAMVLSGYKVGDLMETDIEIIPNNMRFGEILRFIEESEQMSYPVIDDEGSLRGIIFEKDIRTFVAKDEIYNIIVADELCHHRYQYLKESDELFLAWRIFENTSYDSIPVISDKDKKKLLGLIFRNDIIVLYREQKTKETLTFER